MRLIATAAAALALAPLLSGCVVVRQFTDQPAPEAASLPGHVEPVHAAVIAQNQAAFWVSSNGCTAKADIQPVVRQSSDGPIITLRRIKEDRCRQVQPEGVEMRWSFEELGLADGSRLSVENPYQLPPG
ncbi:hypothetical protein [Brevundimonas sp. Root1423]|uniref:hypothetical protein n=1 Tax=Brevundimonas sp. Root1423 TaxID=1736462 RepID=UPI0006FDF199|nr:hypothetical protein [Brevundimonas sp. Root1423]KQY84716.1 hypothetical protein ASD25_06710 [Brevundimonas sp. Root1423]